MFDNIINLNNYFNIKENFALVSGGNNTSINDSTKIKKSFETNDKIDRSMLVTSVTKLVNNVSSDVVQKNSSNAASAVGASNTVWISNIKCDNVTISGIKQKSQADNTTVVKASQTNQSKISNDISTSIDKTIEKVGGTDLAALEAENTKKLNEFMQAKPGYDPDKALKLAGACPGEGGGLFSVANDCKVDSSYELDATVKQALDLDESFKINDTDDISTEIKTKLEQSNFASCTANASASNQIVLQDISCDAMNAMNKSKGKGSISLTDFEQEAIGKLYMTCVFDQTNVSDIANKMVTKIAKKYNQIYDAIEKKGAEKGQEWVDEKMKLADLLAGAGAEKIIGAAGNLPPATNTPAAAPTSTAPTSTAPKPNAPTSTTPTSTAPKPNAPKPNAPTSTAPTSTEPKPNAPTSTATPAAAVNKGMSVESMFIIAAVVILLLIGMGIAGYLLIKKTNAERNNMRNNNMGNYGNPYNFKYLKN
jgi:hypothetical protein